MTASLAKLCAGRIHYSWIALSVAFMVTIAAVGVRAAPGVLILPLQQAFGWDVGMISAAISVNILLLGLLGPFITALMEVMGLKRTIVACLVVLLLGCVVSAFLRTPWQLFLSWGLLVGIGASAGAVGMAAAIANRWFTQRRGFAMGLLASGNAAGQLIFLPLLGHLAQNFGWRSVSFAVTAAVAAAVPIVLLLLPESPREVGLLPFGTTHDTPDLPSSKNPFGVALDGLSRGMRSVDFWLLAITFGICGLSTNGLIGTHMIAYCEDSGYTQVAASSILASLGIFNIIGSAGSGWLTDRYNPRLLLFWIFGLRGLALLLLPYSDLSPASLTVFAVFYGLDWIASAPPMFALINEVFGRRDAPVIVSWIFAVHQIGGAGAALGAGYLRGWTGSYLLAFIASGLACFAAAALVLRIARSSSTASIVPVAGE